MNLSDIYARGEGFFAQKEFGLLMEYVETGFIQDNDRLVLDRTTIRQRCIDAVPASTTCSHLGVDLATPVVMSAMTMPIPAIAEDGLLQVARGLKAAGSLMWTGTPLPKNLSELTATGVPLAANVKPLKDRDTMHREIEAILEGGAAWLGLEIDSGQGTKVQDREMGFDCTPFQQSELEAIRKKSPIPVVCKGVLSPEDAKKCVDSGADMIVLSNHGGHTLDYLPHPFQVMEEVVAAVDGKATIMVDGGFRRGSDIFKGLAMGASLTGIGRPILLGLAADGETGVTAVVQAITRELERIMTMAGVAVPAEATTDLLISF